MDFEEEVNKLLAEIPQDRQTFLFSATMTSKVEKLKRASLRNPVKIEVSTKYQTVGDSASCWIRNDVLFSRYFQIGTKIDPALYFLSTETQRLPSGACVATATGQFIHGILFDL